MTPSSIELSSQFYLVNVAIASVVACGIGLLADWFCRNRSVPLRHGLLVSALCLTLASPVLVWLVTPLDFGLLRIAAKDKVTAIESPHLVVSAGPDKPATPMEATPVPAQEMPRAAPVAIPANNHRVFSFAFIKYLAVVVWALGSVIGFVFFTRGVSLLRQLRRSLVIPQNTRCRKILAQVFAEIRVSAVAEVFESSMAPAPLSFGLLRPVIVLPQGLAEELDDEQLRLVLAHEAAHVVRHDHWIAILQYFASIVFWWNLFLRAVNRRLELLREEICDDYAVASNGQGRRLAEILLQLATRESLYRLPAPGATAMLDNSRNDLEQRITRLMQKRRISIRMTRISIVITSAFALLMCGVVSIAALRADVEPSVEDLALQELAAERAEIIAEIRRFGTCNDTDLPPPKLLNVMLTSHEVKDAFVERLAELDDIGELTLNGPKLTDKAFEYVGRMANLRFLTIGDSKISNKGLKHLENLKQLETISIDSLRITDDGLASLSELPNLNKVSLSGGRITDEGIRRLTEFPALTSLSINSNLVTDVGLGYLAKMKKLESLHLSCNQITEAGIQQLKSAASLQNISLGCPQATDAWLAPLGEMTNLEHIYLIDVPITDDGLQHLQKLILLRDLTLSKTKVKGDGLKHLPKLSQLERLTLTGSVVDDSALAHLQQFPQLKHLQVGANSADNGPYRLTDAGLKYLRGAPRLQFVIFRGTRITDAGMQDLATIPNLRTVVFRWNSGVTEIGAAKLKAANPRIVVMGQNAVAAPVEDSSNAEETLTPEALVEREAILSEIKKLGGNCNITHHKGQERLQISLNGPGVTDALVERLTRLRHVWFLSLMHDNKITDVGIRHIGQMTELENLRIASEQISDASLDPLQKLPKLTDLGLWSEKITDEGLKRLVDFPAISDVGIYSQAITNDGLKHAAKIKALKHLALSSKKLGDEGLKVLTSVPNLKGVQLYGSEITDAGMLTLGEITTLRYIYLSGVPITDAGLASLSRLTQVYGLHLYNTNVTGEGLKSLSSLAKLQQINVFGASVNDSIFVHLHQFPMLTHLSVGVTESNGPVRELVQITDEGLKALQAVPSIRSLEFDRVRITDAGMEHLTTLPELQSVSFFRTPGVTDAGLNKLKEAIPELHAQRYQ